MKTVWRRLSCGALALAMLLTLLPAGAAAELEEETEAVQEEVSIEPEEVPEEGPEETPPEETPEEKPEEPEVSMALAAAVTSGDFSYTVLSEEEKTCSITGYTGAGGEVTIPGTLDGYTVTKIGSNAFKDCTSLTSIEIPDSVTKLGERVFKDCVNLTAFGYPAGWSQVDYAYRVFEGCTALKTITVDEGVTAIPAYAFAYAPALETVVLPSSLKTIGNSAFRECGALTGVNLPEGLTAIDSHAFSDCGSLASITLPQSLTAVGSYAFSSCTALTAITVPGNVATLSDHAFLKCTNLVDVHLSEGLKTIQGWAFEKCSFSSIEIPDSVTRLGERVFKDCVNLTEFGYPAGWSQVDYAYRVFEGCTVLKTITVDEGVTAIPSYAFAYAPALETVVLPKSLETINSYAFRECGALTSVNLPEGLTTINSYAFADCTALAAITLPQSLTAVGSYAFSNCTALTEITVPGNVVTLSDHAFLKCTNLVDVHLSEGLETIQGWAFEKCSFSSIEIPDSVTRLGERVFKDCVSLTEFGYPAGWSQVDYAYRVFEGCTALKTITVDEGVTAIPSYAFAYAPALETVVLPKSLETINSYAFRECKVLTSVNLPEGLTAINSYAFADCTALAAITLPQSLTVIGSDAFDGCTALTEITVPGNVATLSDRAFRNCVNLREVHLSDGLETIQGWAFEKCGFSSIEIPDSVTRLGERVFKDCVNLTEFGYPAGWSKVDYAYRVFEGCTALKTITVDEGVTAIPSYAFAYAPALETVVLPKSLETIGDSAFKECGTLTAIEIPKTVKTIANTAFNGCSSLTIYCYAASAAETVAKAQNWRYKLLDDHVHTYSVTAETAPTCTQKGAKTHTCSTCGFHYDEPVDALGHEYVETVIPPTCTARGYTRHTCIRGDYTYNDTYVNAIPHQYGDWIVDAAPTPAKEGGKHRTCVYECGNEEREAIPATELDAGYGLVRFSVVNAQTLAPIEGAQIFASTERDGNLTVRTDAGGAASMVLPVGKQSLAVGSPDCRTRSLTLNVTPGENTAPTVGLSGKPVYDVALNHHEMTLEEIKEAGIDTSAAGNQHVYKYELKLTFVPEIDWLSLVYYLTEDGLFLWGGEYIPPDSPYAPPPGDPPPAKGSGSSKEGRPVLWVYDPDPSGVGPGSGHFHIPAFEDEEEMDVYIVSENFYLIIRGEVRWLKEMFDVEMLVVNNSGTDTMEDVTATLTLPETGLSLATMVGEQQTLRQTIGAIPGGESRSVHWYVRGDSAGSYTVSALLQGRLKEVDQLINDRFDCPAPLQVLAGNALHLHFEFPSAAYYGEDYPVTVTLTNTSGKNIYGVYHAFQLIQGMEYFYSDGSSEKKEIPSEWFRETSRVFGPGDQIILRGSVNIFFKSKIIEEQLKKLLEMVDSAERFMQGYKAVQAALNAAKLVTDGVTSCGKAIDDYLNKTVIGSVEKAVLFRELQKAISELAEAYSGSENKTVSAARKLGSAGLDMTLNIIQEDPAKWLAEHSVEDIQKLLEGVRAVGSSFSKDGQDQGDEAFDIFDAIRTAISLIPVRFVLKSVSMTEDPGNTTSIPWDYSISSGGPRYFGIGAVSGVYGGLAESLASQVTDEDVPNLFPALAEEAGGRVTRRLTATEDRPTRFQTKGADATHRIWLEQTARGLGNFTLACDAKNGVLENGVLTVTGEAPFTVTPAAGAGGGVLHVESTQGDRTLETTYLLDAVAPHTCAMGSPELLLAPAEGREGVRVRRCETCGEVMDAGTVTVSDLCKAHTFGDWETESEATPAAGGLERRVCSACGLEKLRTTQALPSGAVTISAVLAEQEVKVTNDSQTPLTGQLLLASYGGGRMLGLTAGETVTLRPQDTASLPLPQSDGERADEYRVFLVDPETKRPLCPAPRPT